MLILIFALSNLCIYTLVFAHVLCLVLSFDGCFVFCFVHGFLLFWFLLILLLKLICIWILSCSSVSFTKYNRRIDHNPVKRILFLWQGSNTNENKTEWFCTLDNSFIWKYIILQNFLRVHSCQGHYVRIYTDCLDAYGRNLGDRPPSAISQCHKENVAHDLSTLKVSGFSTSQSGGPKSGGLGGPSAVLSVMASAILCA